MKTSRNSHLNKSGPNRFGMGISTVATSRRRKSWGGLSSLSILGRFLCGGGLLLASLIGLSACAKKDVSSLADRQPTLVLEEFFDGESVAFGIFEDRFGNLQRQFKVNLRGVVTGNRLVLDEAFLYEDGESASRIWTIDNLGRGDDGNIRYGGSAADVSGRAAGQVRGNGLNWQYDVELEMSGRKLMVHFDDWIYQQSEEIAINRAYVSKLGIEIGSVTIVFLRGKAAAAIGPLDLQNWLPQQ